MIQKKTNNNQRWSLLLLLGFLWITAEAQTVNTGEVYVTNGTIFSTMQDFDNTENSSFYNDGEVYIYADFNNDGTVDFLENTGLTRFQGQNTQGISGTSESYFYDVLFDNSSSQVPFQLSGKMTIAGESNFNRGIVDNDNFGGSISFDNNAYHTNTSDYSHVDGSVNKIGETAFEFPIGDAGYYRFGGISAPNNQGTVFIAKYYFENSNDLHAHELKASGIEEIDNREYWTIQQSSSTNEDVLITLSWRDVTTPQSMIDAAQQDALTIIRWDEETNMWLDEGGAINLDAKTVTTAVDDYGIFTFGRLDSDTALPGKIVVYNALTPNGDGKNDFFFIDNQDPAVQNMRVQIYNRWGVKVFETDNYGQSGNVFRGYSTGRLTVDSSKLLPTGTYYYILDYNYDSNGEKKRYNQAGFLYLSGN